MKAPKQPNRYLRASYDTLSRERELAIDDLLHLLTAVRIDEDHDNFNKALDRLTIAHTALTFDWFSGPHKR